MPAPKAPSAGSTPCTASLACITVTYQPDLHILKRQLDQAPADSWKILVDNGSHESIREKLKSLASREDGITLEQLPNNLGLAAALNRGLSLARTKPHITRVLLLDQDTEPTSGQIKSLLEWHAKLQSQDPQTGCIGPTLIDPELGLSHGFHRARFGFWTRTNEPDNEGGTIYCDSLNGSGTLMSLDIATELKGFEEAFFIDHVDTEWSFRVRAAGYHLIGVPSVRFAHRMGEHSLRFWFFGWRLWPYRSAQRHFFLFRNAAQLLRRRYVPLTWKIWAAVKLLLTALVHGVADPERHAQLQAMARGVKSGLKRDCPSPGGTQ